MTNAKREPIWESGAEPPVGFRAKPIFSPRIYTTLNMGSERTSTKLGGDVPPTATPPLEILFIPTCILFTCRIAAIVRFIIRPPSVSRIQACGFRTCCFRSGCEHFSLLIIPFSVFSHPSPSLNRVRIKGATKYY
jgi:hypothetical protein